MHRIMRRDIMSFLSESQNRSHTIRGQGVTDMPANSTQAGRAGLKRFRKSKQHGCRLRVTGQLLLLLLSRFSRVRLCATPQTAAHQAPPSLGFSRQEHWSGLPFPSLMCESEVTQSCPTLSDLMDCSPPGSSIHGFSRQEYWSEGAIAFSDRVPRWCQW